jgi:hypothetical protein
MKNRHFKFLFVLFLGLFTAVATFAAESPPTSSQKTERAGNESPKGWPEVAGDVLGKLAWPVVALLIFRHLKTPATSLLNNIAEKAKAARSVKFGEFISIEANSTEEFKNASEKQGLPVAVTGRPDLFRLICKASNKVLAKSTKVMNLPNGCLVQVSTKEIGPSGNLAVAEALSYIPGVNVDVPDSDALAKGSKVTFQPMPSA